MRVIYMVYFPKEDVHHPCQLIEPKHINRIGSNLIVFVYDISSENLLCIILQAELS